MSLLGPVAEAVHVTRSPHMWLPQSTQMVPTLWALDLHGDSDVPSFGDGSKAERPPKDGFIQPIFASMTPQDRQM